ncbi:hypothetical protein ACI0FM_07210 [Paenochrobactrum sp. BZR 588]
MRIIILRCRHFVARHYHRFIYLHITARRFRRLSLFFKRNSLLSGLVRNPQLLHHRLTFPSSTMLIARIKIFNNRSLPVETGEECSRLMNGKPYNPNSNEGHKKPPTDCEPEAFISYLFA